MWPSVLRNPNYRRLWAAATIDSFGSWLLALAVPLQTFTLTGSAMSAGLALAIEALPAVLIGPWAGVAVDRWPRKRVIVLANLASAAGVALMLMATAPGRVAFIYFGLAVESVAVCFLRPALSAVTPAVAGSEPELASANALQAFTNSAFRMLGPLLGTLMVAKGMFEAVIIVDVISYLAAAAIILTVAIPRQKAAAARVSGGLRDGIKHVVRMPMLRGLLVASWVYWTANAALTALLVPFVTVRLHDSGRALGYLIAGLGAGYLIGSAISKILIRGYPTRSLLSGAYAAVGVCFLVLFNATTLPVALAAITASGVPGAVAQVATQHRLQSATPDAVLGRVSAAFYTSDAVAAVAGALLGPAILAWTSLATALNASSAAVLAAAVIAATMLSHSPAPGGQCGRWPVEREKTP